MAKPLIEIVKVGKRGVLVVPRRVRSTLGWQEGDELMVTVDDKRVVMERRTRGFSTYLEVMSPGEGENVAPRSDGTAQRRGLGRFLTR